MNLSYVAFIHEKTKDNLLTLAGKDLYLPRKNEGIAIDQKGYEVTDLIHCYENKEGVNHAYIYVYIKEIGEKEESI